MSDEDWVKAAMVDDKLAAELLVMLNQAKYPPPPPPPSENPAFSLGWSVRQRRSKSVMFQPKKRAPTASPTTPLSWSGATSVSGGVVGSGNYSLDGSPEEESSSRRPSPFVSPPKCSGVSRSKDIGTSEITINKRSRKKKTLVDLKEEEAILQKERRQLERELATLRLNLEKERARNESFQRLELLALPAVESGRIGKSDWETFDQLPRCIDPVPALLPPLLITSNGKFVRSHPENTSFEGNKETTDGKFVLPDLNVPFEENSSSDLCGVS